MISPHFLPSCFDLVPLVAPQRPIRTMALNFNSPRRIFSAFGGLFVLFGGGFYLARRIVSSRRLTDLEDYRARESSFRSNNLRLRPNHWVQTQRPQAKPRATRRRVRERVPPRINNSREPCLKSLELAYVAVATSLPPPDAMTSYKSRPSGCLCTCSAVH
ncbi:hypothetical protein B0H11DRAFT_8147 [Mycena galericulata]|nr:hypothetical protein B0H11DRAFT_8147 [Mycena galericulata]